MQTVFARALPLGAACVVSSIACADIVGFNESFTADAANWRNSNGSSVLAWSSTGGPGGGSGGGTGGGSYVTSTFNLSSTTAGGFPPIVIRAQQSYGSSGGGYIGNWLAAGVTGITFQFRHDLAEAINVTGRFASAANFPGAAVVSFTPVLPNTWTTISIDLTPTSPNFVSFEGSTHAAVFSSIANMQLGFTVPASMVGQNIDGHFDLANFSIVPAPAAFALLGLGSMGASRRRR